MIPLRFPARRLLATTLLLSTFLCAIAAPLSLPVPGGGGNSSPTAPGNNATSVSGINAPPVPGNNAPPVSGANPPPGSETCKQVEDLNLPSDKGEQTLYLTHVRSTFRLFLTSDDLAYM